MTGTKGKSYDNPAVLRRIIARTHRDAGGDDALFIAANELREDILSGELAPAEPKDLARCSNCPGEHATPRRSRKAEADGPDRVPFDEDASFARLTALALERAGTVADVYGELLLLLGDCGHMADMERQQRRGASYRQLAYVAHLAKMNKRERVGWYRLAEDVSLADRHAAHLISRLKKSEAA